MDLTHLLSHSLVPGHRTQLPAGNGHCGVVHSIWGAAPGPVTGTCALQGASTCQSRDSSTSLWSGKDPPLHWWGQRAAERMCSQHCAAIKYLGIDQVELRLSQEPPLGWSAPRLGSHPRGPRRCLSEHTVGHPDNNRREMSSGVPRGHGGAWAACGRMRGACRECSSAWAGQNGRRWEDSWLPGGRVGGQGGC